MQIPVTEIYIQMGNHEIKWVVNGFYEVFLCIKLFTYWVKYLYIIFIYYIYYIYFSL